MSKNNGSPTSDGMELPGIHDHASDLSRRGQKHYLKLSAIRLISLFVAAIAGAVGLTVGSFDLSGLVLVLAFSSAAIAEIALIYFQPERDWYAGRAIAESTKTLAWRFSVQGDPFGPNLDLSEAKVLFRSRVAEILGRGRDRIPISQGSAVVTESMMNLRKQSFEMRRSSYVTYRTEEQQAWYSSKATFNQSRATLWRYGLLFGEIAAVVIAAMMFGRAEPLDYAGIVAALIAGGAAWLALKQYSQITSAYRVAASELTLQADILVSVEEADWPQAVADAEEAISREHTMWLASRGEEPLPPLSNPKNLRSLSGQGDVRGV